MGERKIQVVPSNGHFTNQPYGSKPDVWSKLRGDEDFRNLDSTKAWELVGAAVAELLGTAILVGLGCSSIITAIPGSESHESHLNTILTFAFAISLVITVFAHISGAHFNPAVSLSAIIFGHISIPKFIVYSCAQCVGATLGIAAVKLISPAECTATSFCVTQPNPAVGDVRAMIAEAFLTGILVLMVDAVWDRRCQDKHDSLPIKFGVGLVAILLPGAKYAGASLNPARSFGPALMSGNWDKQWIYWIGPIGGSIVASAIYRTFLSEVNPPQAVRTTDPEEEHPL